MGNVLPFDCCYPGVKHRFLSWFFVSLRTDKWKEPTILDKSPWDTCVNA